MNDEIQKVREAAFILRPTTEKKYNDFWRHQTQIVVVEYWQGINNSYVREQRMRYLGSLQYLPTERVAEIDRALRTRQLILETLRY
jgi:hypothetical protein